MIGPYRSLHRFAAATLLGLLFHPVYSARSLSPFQSKSGTYDAASQIPRPVIPRRTFLVTDYGAVGDGKTLNTTALSKAIEACQAAGGGTVRVPPGRFLTGPIVLASSLDLHLERGASLLLSNDPSQYTLRPGRFADGISAVDCHDVALTGPGEIDGQGQAWWDEFRQRRGAMPHRPHLIVLTRCTRVLVQEVSLRNSPMFHLVPHQCQDVVVEGIRVEAPANAPNTDGIDPAGRNILIRRSFFDVGDDCIALKPSGRGDAEHPSCENITIIDCTFMHGHGLSIGGQTPGGLRHMTVRDCRFEGTDAGIRMKASRGAGGLVEDLSYENLRMKNVKVAILITSFYPRIPKEPENDPAQPVTRTTPIWRKIRIHDLSAEGGAVAGRILGLAEVPVSDLELTNVRIAAAKGMEIAHARGIRFLKSQIRPSSGPPLILHDAEVSGLSSASPQRP